MATRVGVTQRVGPYRVTLKEVGPVVGANWSAIEARLSVRRGDGAAFDLAPQSRFFTNPPMITSESAIGTRLDGQLYTVLGQQDNSGRWQLRLWWKPFVTLIWLGGLLVAIGGALSLVGRTRRAARAAQSEAKA